MALPPEPLFELLSRAVVIVDAEVRAVLSEGPESARAGGPPSAPMRLRSQRVRLEVRKVLRGPESLTELIVEKPEGAYVLSKGNHGPFLLDGSDPAVILGRYGPDTYSLATLEGALTET